MRRESRGTKQGNTHGTSCSVLSQKERRVYCKYCGAKLIRDCVGWKCPTRNCQWEYGVEDEGCGTVAKANDLPMQDTNLVKDVEK